MSVTQNTLFILTMDCYFFLKFANCRHQIKQMVMGANGPNGLFSPIHSHDPITKSNALKQAKRHHVFIIYKQTPCHCDQQCLSVAAVVLQKKP